MSQNSLLLSTQLITALNSALDSLSRWLSGPDEPTATVLGLSDLKGVLWHDTATNMLKVRDQADTAWIAIGTFDEANKLFSANVKTDASLIQVDSVLSTHDPVTVISTSQGVDAGNHRNNLVASAAVTLTLAQAGSIANGACAFSVLAQGGAVTFTPNAADSIVAGATQQAAGQSYVLAQGASAFVVCDGAGKWYLFEQAAPVSISTVPVRQTALSGVTDANGRAAFVTTGSGLQPGLLASASPLVLAFAHGFGASGAVDYVEEITADNAAFFPALPANAASYLYADRNGAGNVVGGSTLAPVQYGQAYNQANQSSLSLNNSVLDDFGNTWVNSGVTFSNASPFFDSVYCGVVPSESCYISSFIESLPNSGDNNLSIRIFYKFAALPDNQYWFNALNGSNYGLQIGVSPTGKTLVYFSSTGSSWDVANGATGSATLVTDTAYFLEFTYDALAGKWYLYVNGVLDQTINSTARPCRFSLLRIGAAIGSMGGFEMLPYCEHPNGTTYTVPTALPDVTAAGYASDWFDISAMQMKRVSAPSTAAGANPAFSAVDRVYLGKAHTGASMVNDTVSYALQGRYVQPWQGPGLPGAGTILAAFDNVGMLMKNAKLELMNINADLGYGAGTVVENPMTLVSSSFSSSFVPAFTDMTTTMKSGAVSSFYLVNNMSGSGNVASPESWSYRISVNRSF